LICPNCGRRNPSGATFCSRCRQRLPLAAKYSGQGYKRAVIAEPTGGGGGGALVLGVALLAGFLFIGGGAAIYLSTPPQAAPTIPNFVSDASVGPSLSDFVQDTPTPVITAPPTPTPFFFSPDPGSPGLFSAPPTFGLPTPTPPPIGPTPTPPPGGPTPTPTPTPTPSGQNAGFAMVVSGDRVQFSNNSTGSGLTFLWDFGDGSGKTSSHPTHTYPNVTKDYTVILTVTDSLGRTATRTKTLHIDAVVATPTPTQPPPTATPTPTPTPSPTP
jgi:hypothetical protein